MVTETLKTTTETRHEAQIDSSIENSLFDNKPVTNFEFWQMQKYGNVIPQDENEYEEQDDNRMPNYYEREILNHG